MKYGKAIPDPHSAPDGSPVFLFLPASDERSHFTPSRPEQSSIISCQASPVADLNKTRTAWGNV